MMQLHRGRQMDTSIRGDTSVDGSFDAPPNAPIPFSSHFISNCLQVYIQFTQFFLILYVMLARITHLTYLDLLWLITFTSSFTVQRYSHQNKCSLIHITAETKVTSCIKSKDIICGRNCASRSEQIRQIDGGIKSPRISTLLKVH